MKRFGLKHLRVTPEEKDASTQAVIDSEELARKARLILGESTKVGDSLRQLRQENHFGRSLTHAFRTHPGGNL